MGVFGVVCVCIGFEVGVLVGVGSPMVWAISVYRPVKVLNMHNTYDKMASSST
jgi:hypothetical protein